MAKKVKRKKKTNKVERFFNKKCNDLTVKETLIYGAVASVAAVIVSVVPFAVIGYMEKKNSEPAEVRWDFPTLGDADEATEEVDED